MQRVGSDGCEPRESQLELSCGILQLLGEPSGNSGWLRSVEQIPQPGQAAGLVGRVTGKADDSLPWRGISWHRFTCTPPRPGCGDHRQQPMGRALLEERIAAALRRQLPVRREGWAMDDRFDAYANGKSQIIMNVIDSTGPNA